MKFPKSIWFFIATAILFLLQVVPFTGIFLMFLAAPFWSVALINLGFVGIAFEAFSNRILKLWLLAPVLWFVGYPAYVLYDNAKQESLASSLTKENSTVHIPFDPDSEDLFWNSQDLEKLIRNYEIPAIYQKSDASYSTHTYSGSAPDRVTFLTSDKICETFNQNNPKYYSSGIIGLGLLTDSLTHGNHTRIKDICMFSMYENSVRPKIMVSGFPVGDKRLRSDRTKDQIRILLPNGSTYFLNVAITRKLSWFPMPAIGCGLVSGGPLEGWKCFAQFWAEEDIPLLPHSLSGNYETEILADALGLKKRVGTLNPTFPDDVVEKRIEYSISKWSN